MATTLETPTAPKVRNNGHKRKEQNCICYEGPLENLPYPETFELEAAIDCMFTNGYAVIPGVLNKQEVAELKHKMLTEGEPDEKYDHTKIGWCFNKHLPVEYHKDPHFLRYIDRPGVLDVAEALLGSGLHIKSGSMWVTGPGRKMPVHVDMLPIQLPPEYAADPRVFVPAFCCVAQFYLDDLTADIGPTILIPGSFRSSRLPDNENEWNGRKPKAAMVKAGDVVIFRFDTWHGAYANTNPEGKRRHIMQMEYSHHTVALAYPPMAYDHYYNPEVVKQATPRQRALLGAAPPKAEEKKY